MAEGEIDIILNDLKKDSEKVMHELANIEDLLVGMQEYVLSGKLSKEKLLADIQVIRSKIGMIEQLDSQEFKEEEAASNLMNKLRGMVDKCI